MMVKYNKGTFFAHTIFYEAEAEAHYLESIQALESTNCFSCVLNNHVGDIHCEQAGNIFLLTILKRNFCGNSDICQFGLKFLLPLWQNVVCPNRDYTAIL